jgi:hypothetical protein
MYAAARASDKKRKSCAGPVCTRVLGANFADSVASAQTALTENSSNFTGPAAR